MLNLAIKETATRLRKQGRTYSEIKKVIGPLAKSTLSNWLKSIELTLSQKNRIQKKMTDQGAIGRQKGGWKNHQKRLERIAKIQAEAQKEFLLLSKNPLFMTGLALYLAEGSKKSERFEFMNSDPFLIKIMIKWLSRFGDTPTAKIRARLYAHELYAHKNYEKFWANFLEINASQFHKTIYKSTVHKSKKNLDYKGCLRIDIKGSELFWKIMKWRDMLYKEI